VGLALKQHVREEMREAGPAFTLVRGSDVIPEIHRDNGSRVILRERDEEAVVEVKGFYGNPHCRKLPAMQCLWNPLCARA